MEITDSDLINSIERHKFNDDSHIIEVFKLKIPEKDKGCYIPIFQISSTQLDWQKYYSFNWQSWCFWYAKECMCSHVYCSSVKNMINSNNIRQLFNYTYNIQQIPLKKRKKTSSPTLKPALELSQVNYGFKQLSGMLFYHLDENLHLYYGGLLSKGYNEIPILMTSTELEYLISSKKFNTYFNIIFTTIHNGNLHLYCPHDIYLDTCQPILTFEGKANEYSITSLPPPTFTRLDVTILPYKNMYFELRDNTERNIKALAKLFNFFQIHDDNIHDIGHNKTFSFLVNTKDLTYTLTESNYTKDDFFELFKSWNSLAVHCHDISISVSECSDFSKISTITPPLFHFKSLGVSGFELANDSKKSFIMIKPTGMFGPNFSLIVDNLFQDNEFYIDKFVYFKKLSTENFHKIYPTALSKIFGQSWYNYLTSGPVFCAQVNTTSLKSLRHLIFKIRYLSKIPYPENPIHCCDSISEYNRNISDIFSVLDDSAKSNNN